MKLIINSTLTEKFDSLRVDIQKVNATESLDRLREDMRKFNATIDILNAVDFNLNGSLQELKKKLDETF